jgi:hypothetical protein
MPHVLSDVLVQLKASNERADTDAVADEIREALEDVPGIAALFTTPLGMRIDEGLGGTPAELSIRVACASPLAARSCRSSGKDSATTGSRYFRRSHSGRRSPRSPHCR